MASKYGKRAAGSDGNDFLHREKVASHYQESANWKNSLKKVLVFQSASILFSMGVTIFYFNFPSLLYVIGGFIGIPCCWQAIKTNKTNFINIYGVCCSMFGVFPMAFTIYSSFWTGGIQPAAAVSIRVIEALGATIVCGVGAFYAKKLLMLWMGIGRTSRQRNAYR